MSSTKWTKTRGKHVKGKTPRKVQKDIRKYTIKRKNKQDDDEHEGKNKKKRISYQEGDTSSSQEDFSTDSTGYISVFEVTNGVRKKVVNQPEIAKEDKTMEENNDDDVIIEDVIQPNSTNRKCAKEKLQLCDDPPVYHKKEKCDDSPAPLMTPSTEDKDDLFEWLNQSTQTLLENERLSEESLLSIIECDTQEFLAQL
jgi:hypothetical protein